MLYNQPWDQKSNPNAPYVDGNQAAGIEGSIVPAAGIEFDQREIVDVIYQAWVRKYADFNGTLCAAPSNGDLTQLRKAIEGYITNWFISTSVTFKVHGPGADFADLNAALNYLSKFRITQTGKVTLQLAGATSGTATQYVYTQNVVFAHPDNEKISVLGAPMLLPLPGDDSAYQLISSTSSQRAADTIYNLGLLRSKFATELHFGNGCGFVYDGVCPGRVDGILLTGDGSTGPLGYGVGILCNAISTIHRETDANQLLRGLAIVGFGYAGIEVATSGFWLSQPPSGGGGAPLVILGITNAAGTTGFGVACADSSNFTPQTTTMIFSCCSAGLATFTNSSAQCDLQGLRFYSECNGSHGMYAQSSGSIGCHADYIISKKNGGRGLYCSGGAGIVLGATTSIDLTLNGGSAYCSIESVITCPGATGLGDASPPINTVGNANSIINTLAI